jgi:predicted outer membrane repeat protein
MRKAFVAAAGLIIGLGASLGSVSAASADFPGGPDGPSTACQIRDSTHMFGVPATSLQAAVNTAAAGDTLSVKGICTGTTVIGKSLIIRGYAQNANGRFARKNPPLEWLEADGSPGSVVTIAPGVQVTLEFLVIEGGTGNQQEGATVGGGIDNYGTLVMSGNDVTGNSATFGGGIYNEPGGSLMEALSGGVVDTNTAANGGGLYLADGSVIGGRELSVSNNTALEHGGGVYVALGATVVMNPPPRVPTPWQFPVGGNAPDNVFFE